MSDNVLLPFTVPPFGHEAMVAELVAASKSLLWSMFVEDLSESDLAFVIGMIGVEGTVLPESLSNGILFNTYGLGATASGERCPMPLSWPLALPFW